MMEDTSRCGDALLRLVLEALTALQVSPSDFTAKRPTPCKKPFSSNIKTQSNTPKSMQEQLKRIEMDFLKADSNESRCRSH